MLHRFLGIREERSPATYRSCGSGSRLSGSASEYPSGQVDGAKVHTAVRLFFLYVFVVIGANDGTLAIHLAETSPLTEVNDG
jgi:hypothetical protein